MPDSSLGLFVLQVKKFFYWEREREGGGVGVGEKDSSRTEIIYCANSGNPDQKAYSLQAALMYVFRYIFKGSSLAY